MIFCPESERVQDYLDGVLEPALAARFRVHLEGCEHCAAELTAYRRVWASLDLMPLFDPGADFTERLLDRVLPSRARRRWVAALSWGYGGALAASLAGVAMWVIQPGGQALLRRISGEASRRVVETTVFVFHSIAVTAVRLAEGRSVLASTGARFAPFGRAFSAVMAQPAIGTTLAGALLTCVALMWWMRSREPRSAKEVGHVGVLGF